MADDKTKSLIIRDIPDVLNRVKAVIQELDVPVPQILIEGKVVEVSENLTKSLGGSLSFFGNGGTPFGFAASGGNIDSLLGSVGSESFSAAENTSSMGVEPNLSIIPGFSRLKAILNIKEEEGQTKTLVSPRVVVQNGVAASFNADEPFAAQTPVSGNVGGGTGIATNSANTSLSVTPTVTNDGNILLKLNLTKSDIVAVGSASGSSQKTISTEVYVESGSTLAVGGIYSNKEEHKESGFPWLRKIPVLGWLFGSTSDVSGRSELFMFITPRILNPQKLPSELNTEGSGLDGLSPPAPTGTIDFKKSRFFAENQGKGVK